MVLILSSEPYYDDPMCGLTAKQCQVLDLLIQHKTSKEISRTLGISRHTVDQRILLARAKLQVGSRNEVAQAYRRLLAERFAAPPGSAFGEVSAPAVETDTYHRSIYGLPGIAESDEWGHDDGTETAGNEIPAVLSAVPDWAGAPAQIDPVPAPEKSAEVFFHVLPEAFDGRFGTVLRLGAIALITVFLTLIILGGIAIYSELAHMLDNSPGG